MASTVKNIFILVFWVVWAAWEWRLLQDSSVHSLMFKNSVSTNEIQATLLHELSIKINEEKQLVLLNIISPDVVPPVSSFGGDFNVEELSSDEQAHYELSRILPRPGLFLLEQCLVFSSQTWSCDLEENQLDLLFPNGTISMQDGQWLDIHNVINWRTLGLYYYFDCPQGVCDLWTTTELKALLDQFVID